MRASKPFSGTRIPSSAPPRTSRQRRSRSSGPAVMAPPGPRAGRPRMAATARTAIAARSSSRSSSADETRTGGRPLPSSRAAFSPMARRSGGANSPKVRRSAGSTAANPSGLNPASQPSVRLSSLSSCTRSRPLPARNPSAQPAAAGAGAAAESSRDIAMPASSAVSCPASSSSLVSRPEISGGQRPADASRARVASQRARLGPSPSSPVAAFTASMRSRMARSASSSSEARAVGRPAQIRVIICPATSPSRPGSVPRTSPYLAARTSAGTAAIRWVTSPSSAARSLTAASTSGRASPRSASRHRSTSMARSSSAAAPDARQRARCAAAAATVLPHMLASIRATSSSGRQVSCHVSRNVPMLRVRLSCGTPQGTSSSASRCSRWLRARSVGLRRSRWWSRGAASGRSRRLRCWSRRSRCSGTIGVAAGTAPSRSPTTRRRWMSSVSRSLPSHSTARAASVTSSRPASGRPRRTASVWASRTDSITCAVDAGMPSSRSTAAALASHRSMGWPFDENRWSYQPGDRMPAP